MKQVRLVATHSFLDALGPSLPAIFLPTPKELLNIDELVERSSAGDSFVWIGPPDGLPRDLWIGSFIPSSHKLTIKSAIDSPLPRLEEIHTNSHTHSAFLSPPKEFPKHNIDEEIRAEFLPILEARDRFGSIVGYPGVLLNHVAPSLAGNRFYGSHGYFFFFDQPETDMDISFWLKLLEEIASAEQSGLSVEHVGTNYASYHFGERVQIKIRIRNRCLSAVAMQLRFYHCSPESGKYELISIIRRVAGGDSTTEALCDFRPSHITGLHHIRIDIAQDPDNAEKLAVAGTTRVVMRRDIGFILLSEDWETPQTLEVRGSNLVIEGKPGFFAGTHYYPSNVWWEWAWRDFRPLLAERDFQAMRKAGNRIARVWADPMLDEPALRAMDATIWIAARNGITLDVCVFNQWVRDIGFESPDGKQVSFEFRNRADFNLYSFSLRNLGLQREYVRTLARRWRRAGNVIYNLANETYVKDPDAAQMDKEARAWLETEGPSSTRRDTMLFRSWSDEMTKALREGGSKQIIFPGYLFSLSDGGDTYLANENAPLLPWHGYFPPEWIGQTIHYFDPHCSRRPLLLEEFGSLGWNNAIHYDAAMHYALAAGAGAAMSYEWGVSWLSPEAPFIPLPLRDVLTGHPDPRWFTPAIEYARENTSEYGTGIAPWPSGFGYGSIYHGTPFMAEAAQAVWRLSEFGTGFARSDDTTEKVYVIIPETSPSSIEPAMSLFKELWLHGNRFGVWQETRVDTLPQSAEAILLAGPFLPDRINEWRQQACPDARFYKMGDMSWKVRADLPRVNFSPQGEINCLTRATQTGTLYTFASGKTEELVSAVIEGATISAGLRGFVMVHASKNGINFIEASDEVTIDGIMIFSTSKGRVIASAPEDQPLNHFFKWRIIASEPSEIRFGQPLHRADVLVNGPGGLKTVPLAIREDGLFTIDKELTRYVIEITFVKD